MSLQALIEEATADAEARGGLIGQARCETRMVRIQRITQSRSGLPVHYRTDVWELPSGKKLLKADWQKELGQ